MSEAYATALAPFTARLSGDALIAEAEALTGLSGWGGKR